MAKDDTARTPRSAPTRRTAPAPPAAAAAPRRRSRVRRWIRGLLGGLLLVLLGTAGYGAFLIYQFQHAICHPLPTPEPVVVAPAPASPPARGAAAPFPTPGAGNRTPEVAAAAVAANPGAPPLPAVASPTLRPEPPLARTPALATPTGLLPPGRINILVLGTDGRAELPQDAARSDTLIIASVDVQWKTAGMLSVPRDLQVPVPGYGLQKINAAYFYGEYAHLPGGGPGLAVATVSQFFNIPIPYYLAINFDGFQKIIDSIGGIDVYIPSAIDDPLYPGPNNSYIHVHFDAGCQHLDSVQALEYARTRHSDSDFGRNRRQQQVIQAVRARVLQLDMIPRFGLLLGQLGDAIQTNIPPDQQLRFAELAGQIATPDIYTAQIDNTLVDTIPGSSDLALRADQARPLLDWFFGRGPFAALKPGVAAVRPPAARSPTPTVLPGGKCP